VKCELSTQLPTADLIQHVWHYEFELRDIHGESFPCIHSYHVVKTGHHSDGEGQYAEAAVRMNGIVLDDRLLPDDTITIHHFLGAIGFCDIPMTGNQLDGVFIIIRDMDRVHMQVL